MFGVTFVLFSVLSGGRVCLLLVTVVDRVRDPRVE